MMHFLEFFFPKPAHTEVRYVAATKAESKAAQTRAIGRRLELEFMAIHMTPEQRAAAKARALSKSLSTPVKKEEDA